MIPMPKNRFQAAGQAIDDACTLITEVRDVDPVDVWDMLSSWSPTRVAACLITLAAAHSDETSIESSLDWVRSLA